MNILFLDKEGGFGGSSRSLYFLVKNLNRSINPFVLLREKGPMLEEYRALGVTTFLREGMPIYKPSPRNNLFVLFLFFLKVGSLVRSYRFLSRILTQYPIDILHMNHDGFFVYGFLKRTKRIKIVVHLRTMLPLNTFARFQVKCIQQMADHLVFISENELLRFSQLSGRMPPNSSVIFNAAEPLRRSSCQSKVSDLPEDMTKVLYLGNLTYTKGADRLLEIARELERRRVRNVLFVVCGEDRQRKGTREGIKLVSMADKEGLKDRFLFMGHQAYPDPFLRQADILLRLSRCDDPWGRDIIEAMVYGKPAIATGTYEGFIVPGVTGYLINPYSAEEAADKIIELASNPERRLGMGRAGFERARELFDVRRHSMSVMNVYERILAGDS